MFEIRLRESGNQFIELWSPVDSLLYGDVPSKLLHSEDAVFLNVPRTVHKYGHDCFKHAATFLYQINEIISQCTCLNS